MNRTIFLGALLAVVTVSTAVPQTQPAAPVAGQVSATANASEQARATVTTYCATCHSTQAKMGGLALDSLSLDAVTKDAATWEKAVRKLRGRLMPPPGSKQPEQKEVDSLIGYLEAY